MNPRSFCSIDNLIEAFVRQMDTDDDFLGPVNLGNPVEFTIKELAEKYHVLIRNEVTEDTENILKLLKIKPPARVIHIRHSAYC